MGEYLVTGESSHVGTTLDQSGSSVSYEWIAFGHDDERPTDAIDCDIARRVLQEVIYVGICERVYFDLSDLVTADLWEMKSNGPAEHTARCQYELDFAGEIRVDQYFNQMRQGSKAVGIIYHNDMIPIVIQCCQVALDALRLGTCVPELIVFWDNLR